MIRLQRSVSSDTISASPVPQARRSHVTADNFVEYYELHNVFTRKEPLCDHEIDRFEELSTKLAREYAPE